MGLAMYFIFLHVAMYMIYGLIKLFMRLFSCKSGKFMQRAKEYLFLSGVIRLYMELYLDATLFSMMTLLRSGVWRKDFAAVTFSEIMATIFLTLVSILPPLLAVYYYRNRDSWKDESFKKYRGAFLTGTNIDYKGAKLILLFFPLTFLIRRLIFSLTALFLEDSLIAQLLI